GGSGEGGGDGGQGGSGGPACPAPLVDCGGECVDLQSDVQHCGICNHYCPTELCVLGACTGGPVGHVVVLGMDFEQVLPPARKLLGNAVFLPLQDPVRILDYREHAGAASMAAVDAAIAAEAKARGRGYATSQVAPAGELGAKLASGQFDLLLVHDQPGAPDGALGSLGATVADALSAFAKAGGVVVVLATGNGTGQMSDFLTGAGLLDTSGFVAITGQPLYNTGPADAVGLGVMSPFLAKPTTSVLVTLEAPGPLLTYVVSSQKGKPVAIHRVVAQ
ncbi:MAG: hypothetical protein HY744_21715, partial [Deltaproteobacteria bacterium]|nr:hypothetical protein [Deltaproteobacteria bacterium]